MTIEEVLQLIRAKWQKDLNPLQELVLRKVWDSQTYSDIAEGSNYGEKSLRNTASILWQSLSEIFQIPVTKANLRSTLEQRSLTDG